MIIQCEQCRTKFKLDDEKVTKRGARVRCAKCRHVFVVHRPDAANLPTSADETGAMSAPPLVAGTADPDQTDATADFNFGEVSFADVTTEDMTPLAAPGWDDKTVIMPPTSSSLSTPTTGVNFGSVTPQSTDTRPTADIHFDLGEDHQTTPSTSNITFDLTTKSSAVAASTGDIDFGGFDFGDVSVDKPDESFSLDGADFGNLSAGSQPAAGDAADFGFNFDMAEAQTVTAPSDGFDFSGLDFGSAQTGTAAASTKEIESFSMIDFDFGGEATSVSMPANNADQTSILFNLSQPQTAASTTPDYPQTPSTAAASQTSAEEFTFNQTLQEEPSPLSISSRRRQSPIFSALIVVACLLMIGVLAFFAYSLIGSNDQIASLFNKSAPAEDGRIVVQNLQASFLTKSTAGDLLIITGEALNNFSKPRAALQVKATVFDANSQPLLTQTAYAGNQLTRNQLASMTKDKIMTAMGNQFGDSLTNLQVSPGKTIPFTLVIVNPPLESRDFSVEAIGSTVAAAK